jgi:hypothetical protein
MTTNLETLTQLIERGVTRFCLPGWERDEHVQLAPSQTCLVHSADGHFIPLTDLSSPVWLEYVPEYRYKLTITVRGQTHHDLAQMLHTCAASIADRPDLAAIGGHATGEYIYTLEDLQ